MSCVILRSLSKIPSMLFFRNNMIYNRYSYVAIHSTQFFSNILRSTNRYFKTFPNLLHGEYERLPPKAEEDVVNINVIDRDGIEYAIRGKVGDNVMMLAQHHDVDIEGACEASLACCTCHVYVEDPYFERLDEADVKEEDLLDMAPFLAENSRLSCQIILRKDLDGMVLRLPVGTRNMRIDQKGQSESDDR